MKTLLLALCLSGQFPAPPPTPAPRTFDVRSYGAVPDDGADDARAVNAAVSACSAAGGGVVSVPRGRYDMGNPVDLSRVQGVTLRGDGPATVFSTAGYYCGPIVTVGMPGPGTVPAACRPASPLATSGPKASVATLGQYAPAAVGHPLQFGHLSPRNQPDYWSGPDPITWDVALSAPKAAVPFGVVCGCLDTAENPAPWVIRCADGALVLDVRFAGDTQFHRLAAPVDPGSAVWRVTFQVDPASGQCAAWADGRLVASDWLPGWGPGPPAGGLVPHDGISPFGIGFAGRRMDNSPGGVLDFTLHGLRVCRGQVYQWDGPNPGQQAFSAQPALPLTDDTRYFTGAAQVIPDGSLVALLPLDPEPAGAPWLSLSTYRGRGLAAWCPALGWWQTADVALEDLRVAGAQQPCVLLSECGRVSLRRVTCAGASQGVGTLPRMVSYPIYLDQCDLSGWDAPLVSFWQMVESRGLVIGGCGRHGIRTRGGTCLWDGLKVWRLGAYCESVFRHQGDDDGLTQEYRSVVIDNEDAVPSVAIFDVEQCGAQPGALLVDGCQVNTPDPAPYVRLSGSGSSPYRASLRRLGAFSGAKVALRVEPGSTWHGDADLSALKATTAVGRVADFKVDPPTPLFRPPAPPVDPAPAPMPKPVETP